MSSLSQSLGSKQFTTEAYSILTGKSITHHRDVISCHIPYASTTSPKTQIRIITIYPHIISTILWILWITLLFPPSNG